MKRLVTNDNSVYLRQVSVLIFLTSIAYKVVMLPKYLSQNASRDFVLGMAVVMLVEMMMFAIVIYSISIANIPDMYANIWVKRILYSLIIISTSIKFIVLSIETLDYISSLLFQEGRWLFIILTLYPALAYIAYKGANTIARLGEIVIWAVVIAFLFTILFLRAEMEIDNMFPILDNGVGIVADAFLEHSLWFGDFLPFFIVRVDKRRTRLDKASIPIGMVVTYILIVGFYLLFIAIYGDVAPYIKYAFSNIGIYNSISNLLGGVDFPIVCVWMLIAIVKLSFMLYAIVYSIERMLDIGSIKKTTRGIIVAVVTIICMLVLSFAINGTDEMYAFAISPIRYVILVIDYTLPFIVLGIQLRNKRKKMLN